MHNHFLKKYIYSIHRINSVELKSPFTKAGGDGSFAFWDHIAKQRLKAHEGASDTIATAAMSPQGNIYAYAVSYDWFQGPKEVSSYILFFSIPFKKLPFFISFYSLSSFSKSEHSGWQWNFSPPSHRLGERTEKQIERQIFLIMTL